MLFKSGKKVFIGRQIYVGAYRKTYFDCTIQAPRYITFKLPVYLEPFGINIPQWDHILPTKILDSSDPYFLQPVYGTEDIVWYEGRKYRMKIHKRMFKYKGVIKLTPIDGSNDIVWYYTRLRTEQELEIHITENIVAKFFPYKTFIGTVLCIIDKSMPDKVYTELDISSHELNNYANRFFVYIRDEDTEMEYFVPPIILDNYF